MSRHIALIEDEPALRDNCAEALRRQGYKVSTYADRSEALDAFSSWLPDLALIDIGLGDEIDGGFTLCRELRGRSERLPIIFFSARDSDFDIVAGLRMGADDYVTKDVSLPHLTARIATLFRRCDLASTPPEADDVMVRGSLRLDQPRLSVYWKDTQVPLTVTEFWIVRTLARHPGHVRDRENLMKDASMYVDEATITSHIKRIRRKFVAIDPTFDHIVTVYGMGYRWNPQEA